MLEDKGTKIFLDFGMQMGKANQYFTEFLQPRTCNGMGDLFEFGLLPKLKGLYRKDYAKHMGFDGDEDNEIDAVILTHAHVDHAAYLHYLRPNIPIYCSEATRLIMQAFQDTGSSEEYITFKENFMVKLNRFGDLSKITGKEMSYPRKLRLFNNSEKFAIDSVEVEAFPVDHSLPGACGFIINTSMGTIGYTGDLRFHGYTDNLVVCSYPTRDLDRLLSFYNAAKQSGRDLVIDLKQAYILKLFQISEGWKNIYPKPDDKNIKIYLPKKVWGLIDKDIEFWGKKMLLEDYPSMKNFMSNGILAYRMSS